MIFISIDFLAGSPSYWEEQHTVSYTLDDAACIIHLDKLCCLKYFIDDKIVTAKIIRVYTAAKKVDKKDEFAEVEVGYFPDIPGGGEVSKLY